MHHTAMCIPCHCLPCLWLCVADVRVGMYSGRASCCSHRMWSNATMHPWLQDTSATRLRTVSGIVKVVAMLLFQHHSTKRCSIFAFRIRWHELRAQLSDTTGCTRSLLCLLPRFLHSIFRVRQRILRIGYRHRTPFFCFCNRFLFNSALLVFGLPDLLLCLFSDCSFFLFCRALLFLSLPDFTLFCFHSGFQPRNLVSY